MGSVLVTGGAGFIGRQVVAALADMGQRVHIAESRDVESELSCPGEYHVVDLMDAEQVKELVHRARPDALIHLAWCTTPGEYWSAPQNLDWVCASVGLAKAFREAGGTRFVGVGSCAEYDWNYGYCREDVTPLSPRHLYGEAKKAVQMLLSPLFAGGGLSFAWGRVFHLYGPFENPGRFVPSIIIPLLGGATARCVSPHLIRDFMHVEDVGRAIATLAVSDLTGAVNIADGNPISLGCLARKIALAAGREEFLTLAPDPADVPPDRLLVGCPDRLRYGLKFTPRHSLDDGIRSTVEWWRTRQ